MNWSQGITYLCHIAEEGGELYEFLPEEAWRRSSWREQVVHEFSLLYMLFVFEMECSS